MSLLQLHQEVRPSGHSAVIMASHVGFLLSIGIAFKARRLVEAMSLSLSALISLHYHVCDENLWCPYGLDVTIWHALDVWSTFFLICFIFGVMVLDLPNPKHRFILRTVYFVSVTGSVWYDKGSMMLFGGLLASVALLIVARYALAKPSNRQRKKKSLGDLVVGLIVFVIALGCFVLANTPIVGHTRYDPKVDGPLKPMDVPDTSVYWVFHSIWHFSSAISSFFVLRFLTERYAFVSTGVDDFAERSSNAASLLNSTVVQRQRDLS